MAAATIPSVEPAYERRYVGERSAAGARVLGLGGGPDEVVADGACWGRRGPAAEALAWALLLDASGSRIFADDWHADLADEVIARLPEHGFTIDAADLLAWLAEVPA